MRSEGFAFKLNPFRCCEKFLPFENSFRSLKNEKQCLFFFFFDMSTQEGEGDSN
jgi:hypothetical protein